MQKVKQIYQKYQVMIHNFSYLTILKGLTLVLPLITFPYLIQTLGANKYGLVMWAWAIAQIFIVFIKFGFDTLGVKLISENRDNKQKVSQIFSQITYVKIGLILVSLMIFLGLFFTIDKISLNQELFLYFYLFVLFESMLPIWYFQGIENMKIMAILVSSIKLIFALLVFVVIHDESQYLYIPILYAVGSFFSNIVAYYIIMVKDKIRIVSIKIKETYSMIKESFYILFATLGTVLRDRVTIVLIEKYIGFEAVAYFDIAIKIVNILLTPFHIVSQVLYPHIARTKDMILLRKVLFSSLLISFVVVSLFIYNIELIVILVNGKLNQDLVNIISILIFIVPTGLVSAFLGGSVLIILDKSAWIAISVIYASAFYIMGVFTLHYLYILTLKSFGYLFLLFYFIEMLIRILKAKQMQGKIHEC